MATPQSYSATATQRVAPPCWSKEETLVLIEAYKEKWFVLRCQNLKASDWGAVSSAVSFASGPETMKSSVQCRHKIEQLRQRFRAEKQRSLKNRGPELGVKNGNGGVKRGMDPVEEMVSSIKLLAEGFVRMEKMKIEMVKDVEKTRMKMEMKHNEMILESRQKIMDVFAKALLE
ncbi:hypothetical protein V6Z11_D08G196700 [Gossypium hirsutum]